MPRRSAQIAIQLNSDGLDFSPRDFEPTVAEVLKIRLSGTTAGVFAQLMETVKSRSQVISEAIKVRAFLDSRDGAGQPPSLSLYGSYTYTRIGMWELVGIDGDDESALSRGDSMPDEVRVTFRPTIDVTVRLKVFHRKLLEAMLSRPPKRSCARLVREGLWRRWYLERQFKMPEWLQPFVAFVTQDHRAQQWPVDRYLDLVPDRRIRRRQPTNVSSALLPCPFCGHPGQGVFGGVVLCSRCGARGPERRDDIDVKEQTPEWLWNYRIGRRHG